MSYKKVNKLKLLQWNAQGATTKSVITQIDHRLNIENIDVAFIVETFANENHEIKLTNFVVYRNDRGTHGGGVLIAIRNDVEHKRLPNYNTEVAENISIEVKMERLNLVFTSAYVPKYSKHYKNDIFKMTPRSKNFVAFGDFNSKHVAWNCTSNNRAGKVLFNMMQTSNFVIHHPNSFTHHPHCGNKPSTIDFVLTNSPVMFSDMYTLDHALPSDHSPVITTIEGFDVTRKPKVNPNFKKADWSKYSMSLEQQLNAVPFVTSTVNEINYQLRTLINAIKIAESEAVPLETVKKKSVEISKDTVELIQLRRVTKRRKQRCKDSDVREAYSKLINAQNKRIEYMVTKDLNDKWNETVRSIKPGDKKVWSLAKKIMNKNSKSVELLKVDDRYITSDDEIAEALAGQFEKNNLLTIDYRHDIDNQVTKTVDVIDKICPTKLINPEHHVNAEKISKIIKKLKIKKAPGLDGIPNILVKRLPIVAIEHLTNIINACIDHCYFPMQFKTAKVIPILKPKKDHKCALSYRPISLLSSIGKIFERVIRDKLIVFLTEKSIIKDEQFGFREEHSTVHQIRRIVNIITDNKKHRKSTGMFLIDMEKAFDTVWHNGLLYKLSKFGAPIYLIKLIASFLRDRNFVVDVNGTKSTPKAMPAGLAQGSVLSPLLWTVFTSDLKTPPNCLASYYADDTAITSSAKQSNKIIKSLSNGLERLHSYFTKWRIKINHDKTQAILFKFNRSQRRNPTVPLMFNGTVIPLSKEVKYLGATIDEKINFNSNTDSCATKAMNGFKALYPIMHCRSKLSTSNKLTLYKAIIRPKIAYAAPVWHMMNQSNMGKLQVTQNKILKTIHGLPRRFPTRILHEISGIETIKEYVQRQAKNFFTKCRTSTHNLIRQLATEHPAEPGSTEEISS